MADFDYYKVLEVEKNATDAEIKAAYRKMAKKYHPDLYSGASEKEKKEVEEKFKKVNHAYQILSDANKRAAYDQYGDENGPMGQGGFNPGAGGFGGFDDIFSDFFSSFTGGARTSNRANARISGDDITITITIDFKEAAFGVSKDIPVSRDETCTDCNGTGAKNGSAYKTCTKCGGTGTITFRQNTVFGQVVKQAVCPECNGKGKIITDTCKTCGGKGRIRKSRTIHANIPAGIDNGQMMTFYNEGNCGKNGGANGNLIIVVNVRPHALFKRKGFDIYFEVPISFTTAAVGGNITVPTLKDSVTYKIPEGTQSGTVFRLKDKGIKHINRETYGDIYFTVQVQTPSSLSRSQKEALEKFESTLTINQDAKQKKFREYLN